VLLHAASTNSAVAITAPTGTLRYIEVSF